MKRILYITNISNGVSSFSRSSVEAASKVNFEFHLAGNFSEASHSKLSQDEETYGIKIHQIDLNRSPYSFSNFKALRQLIKLIKDENIDYIHCNTPIGGLLGRIAGKYCKVNKVIYQAHGFHFYKGAPLLNWLIYYPIEKFLAHYTDILIIINKEDYALAKKFKLRKNGKICYVPGVGINLEKFNNIKTNKTEKKKEIGLKDSDFICIGIGRLDKNKNFEVCIKALSKLSENVHLIICGEGNQKNELKKLANDLRVENQVHFLGYRSDVYELLQISDCYLSTSQREGLPRALMEAMACGLPCIVSDIRGNADLIKDELGGYLVPTNDSEYISAKINSLSSDELLREKMRLTNLENVKSFDIEIVYHQIADIYKQIQINN